MKFSDIPGHESVKERLRSMVDNNRLPHALVLEGPQGVGKFALARALAQYIHCENRSGGDSCGVCPACRQHATFNHADTYFSFPVLKGGSGSDTVSDDYIAEWHRLLEENPYMNFERWLQLLDNSNGQPVIYSAEGLAVIRKFSRTSYSTRFKILLQWLPERMQPDCANKLLILIEEPFPDSLLIFTSDNPGAILPTVYSRMQRVEIKRLPDDVVADYLVRNHDVAPADSLAIAHLAEGRITRAVAQISVSGESAQFLELFTRLMRSAYQRRVSDLRKWSVDVAGLGREAEIRFLAYCERMMRENFINNMRVPQLVYLNAAEAQFSSRFSPFINERNVESLLGQFASARTDVAANGNAKIILFDLAVKVILLLKR